MANYGFAIDLRKCIGCHACTIACKAEHQIPVGVNRCWVKTVEKGTFPNARRFFFPVLCNQCDAAPCARICPTSALFKRPDGIVDLDGGACIGCRACMAACPYDQLFIDPNSRTAEKCNFCANRIEHDLLPSCVAVCPTECRIFGDLDDPSSEVARIVAREAVTVRKPEKGTKPKIFYIGAEKSVIEPEAAARPFVFREGQVVLRPIGAPEPDPERPGDPRVDYDVPHRKAWGLDMALYLLAKGISTGVMLICAVLWMLGVHNPMTTLVGPVIALAAITITAGLLVFDLERPERFYYILTRGNRRSWMVWGAWFMTVHGALAFAWTLAAWFGAVDLIRYLAFPVFVVSVATTCYTGFLFAQGLARELWQGPQATFDLLAQALVEGAATMLLALAVVPDLGADTGPAHGKGMAGPLVVLLLFMVLARLVFLLVEYVLTPSATRHHELATRTLREGALKVHFWGGAIGAGGLLPVLLAAVWAVVGLPAAPVHVLLALLALGGSFAWEYVWVEAGQSVPLS